MKNMYITIMLLIPFILFSQEKIIDLGNKNKTIETSERKETVLTTKDNISNKELIPKSFYIGELGDKKSSNKINGDILNIADNFFNGIKSNNVKKYISPDFLFIFNDVYSDTLFKNSNDMLFWFLGNVNTDEDRSNLNIEIHFREQILIGTIFMEFSDKWLITDLQLKEQEKGFFDPSSFNILN